MLPVNQVIIHFNKGVYSEYGAWVQSHITLNIAHLILQLSLPNPLRPGVNMRTKK